MSNVQDDPNVPRPVLSLDYRVDDPANLRTRVIRAIGIVSILVGMAHIMSILTFLYVLFQGFHIPFPDRTALIYATGALSDVLYSLMTITGVRYVRAPARAGREILIWVWLIVAARLVNGAVYLFSLRFQIGIAPFNHSVRYSTGTLLIPVTLSDIVIDLAFPLLVIILMSRRSFGTVRPQNAAGMTR